MESPRRSSLDFQEQCRSEEVEAKRWMDRASRYLTEGRFESAIQLLQKTENVFPNCKNLPELMAVTQVCYAATWRACHCARPYTRKLPDWYHVLEVDERADFETIKKRYRQLALLLHPDKNKHVNSEGAFKIITEAYTCLSDKEKRDIFNLERRRSFCRNCNLKAQQHAAGYVARPVAQVHTPQTPNHRNAFGTPKNWESENLQNLRERAKSTVNNLEREFGGKTSKWMQHLGSARQRYRNPTDSPVCAESHSTLKPDPVTIAMCQEHAPRSKVPSSPILHKDSISKTVSDSKPEFSTFEVRRPSTCDAEDMRNEKQEENLDVLLNRLRAERSAAANVSPLTREFGVHTRTPEAGHLLRPLRDIKASRSSSVGNKCDAASLYSTSWMPKGRCLSKKAPHSPVRRPATVHVDRTLPRTSTSEQKGQTTPVRSSSVRLESLYPTSPFHPIGTHPKDVQSATSVRSSSMRSEGLRRSSFARKDENPSSKVVDSAPPVRSSSLKLESLYPASPMKKDDLHSKELHSATAGRSSSVRLESLRRPSLARKDESSLFTEVDSTAPGRSSSVRLENLYPASPAKKDDMMFSKAVDSATPERSSSVRLDDFYQPSLNNEDYLQRSRSIARTTSGSWSNRATAHPQLCDDVLASVNPSASRTPIRKQTSTYVLKTPPVSCTTDASPKVSMLLSEHRQNRVQRGNTPSNERFSSLEKDVKLAPITYSLLNTVDAENGQKDRPPLGSRDENLTSYSSKNQDINSKMSSETEKEIRASQLEQVDNMENKQKSDAINGILERLRAEAKTVAATLDRLRDNVGAEALARPEYV